MSQPFIFAIAAFAILNGMFSPFLRIVVFGVVLPFMPAFFTDSIAVVFFVSSLVLSTLTIMIAGVPAALYERYMGLAESDTVSLYIWLFGTAILTLPAVLTFLQVGGF